MKTSSVKKLKCLGCDALTRILYHCAAQSPHIVDVELLRLGLHNRPADLRQQLQARIDAVTAQDYDAIVLAYGLCGKSTAGLTAKNVPMVIPRAHDCITLFLGSRDRYTEQFETMPGTYWYTHDYIERHENSGTSLSLGAVDGTNMTEVYDEYVEKYGKDNADYLMEIMGAWQEHYQRAAFIDLGVGDSSAVEQLAQAEAARRGWTFERIPGDIGLLQRLLHGDWNEDFLMLEPGQQIIMTSDSTVIDQAACMAE